MSEKKPTKLRYFKIVKDGEVLDIIKASHSNIAARSFFDKIGYSVESAETDDVLSHVMAGNTVPEIKKVRKASRPTAPYKVKGMKPYGSRREAARTKSSRGTEDWTE